MRSRLETGFVLDRRWHRLRGEMEQSKRPALLLLAKTLREADLAYAIIGGVALQVHQEEPRTTLDIDVAVGDRRSIPRAALEACAFRRTGQHRHSENWVSEEGVPIQFTDDPALSDAIERAQEIDLDGVVLRVIGRRDLLQEKLRAGTDPARRRSKRLQDLVDAWTLLEADPALANDLTADERALLDALPQ